MIFRRRRTRIEIEHTTVRMEGGDLYPVDAGPVTVTPAAPSHAESILARLLPLPEMGPTGPNATPSVKTTDATPAKETRS